MDDKEQALEDGLDIQELERQPGWQKVKAQIQEEVRATLQDLRHINLEGRSLESIGSEYIARIQRINGLERVLEIVEETKERHAEASR